MSEELTLADDEIAPLIGRLNRECSLFRDIDPAALGDLLRQLTMPTPR